VQCILCHEDGTSEFQALLDWRNTPQKMEPVLFNVLWAGGENTTADHWYADDSHVWWVRRKSYSWEEAIFQTSLQPRYSRPLKRPKSGDVVLMKRPGPRIWIQAILSRNVAVRSHEVRVNGTTYRWNNRDLLWTNKPLLYLVMNWFQSTTDRLLLWKLHDHNTDISALFISDSQPAAIWTVRHRTVNASETLCLYQKSS